MAYATIVDVNVHLPVDKLQIEDAEAEPLLIDAQRLVRARLTGVFDITVIDSWATPATTPELIREITGKLVAAKFYAKLVAEDEADGSKYAQDLYNEAIQMLTDIRLGNLTVIDPAGDPISNDNLTETSFWPDATTQEPFFKVADTWS